MEAARNHLIVTRDLILKGTIEPVLGRLSDHLRNCEHPMLTLVDARATWLQNGARQELPEVSVSMKRVLLAHEYVDMSGDPHMQAMNATGVGRRYRIVMASLPGLLLVGGLKTLPNARHGFLVLEEPSVESAGGDTEGVAEAVKDLPYLLVNEDLIEAYYAV